MKDKNELKVLAKNYFLARQSFLSAISHDHPELGGNDNIVGRIGEFIALQFLEANGRHVKKCEKSNNKGFDIICDKGIQISVKTITAESKTGRSTQLKQPWQELILIYIGKNYEVETIGHIHIGDYDNARSQGFVKENQVADKKLLEKDKLFSKFGQIYSGDSVKDYL